MKNTIRFIVVALAALVATGCGARALALDTPTSTKPNVIFILTDDQDESTLRHMPALQKLLVERGRVFDNAVNVYPLCCPSRATIQRGQYAHNTGVFGNAPENGGGWPIFQGNDLHESTSATWVQAAGYRTAYYGKYMNYFDPDDGPIPGWHRQYILMRESDMFLDQGNQKPLVAETESRQVADKALTHMHNRLAGSDAPFFLSVGFHAPHLPADSEARFADMFQGVKVPRDPNYNVAPDPDDPRRLRTSPPLTSKERTKYDAAYRRRLLSLMTVDWFIKRLDEELRAAGKADETYIFFYTDNGVHIGDHRLRFGKNMPYEEDTGFPLIVRGPDVPAGSTDNRLVGNHDIAPTIADIAGAETPDFVDGRSFLPLARSEGVPHWRTAIYSERRVIGSGSATTAGWEMVRLEDAAYIHTRDYPDTPEYNPEFEYYDLRVDPYQLDNRADDMDRTALGPLQDRLSRLSGCSGEECRTAEN